MDLSDPLWFLGEPLITMALFIGGLIFWVYVLIDCLRNERRGSSEKVAWVLVQVFGGIVGSLIYFFYRRPRRRGQWHDFF